MAKKDAVSESSDWIKRLILELQAKREEAKLRYEKKVCHHCGDTPDFVAVSASYPERYVCISCIVPYTGNLTDRVTKLPD